MNPDSFSLSELCALLDESLRQSFPATYWVRAEIASLTDRGHCYLELVEKGDRGMFAAKMRATCWSNTWQLISAYFLQETGKRPEPGMQVLVEVTVDFHPVYGLSLNIQNIDPSFTLGDLARQRQFTLQRLEADGVLDMNKSLPLPTVIRRIAVISAKDAAGYGDFCHQLQDNPYGLRFTTELFPAFMQGDGATRSIISALDKINVNCQLSIVNYDCVVLIRGGGAPTDLTCFDTYELASHCAQFPLPILSGIGHTRDVSIVDMVVHSSLKTPTAVAEFLIDHNAGQLVRINELRQRLAFIATQMVAVRRQQIEQLRLTLQYTISRTLQTERNKLNILSQAITLHSPEQIFRKGYSLTLHNGKVLRHAADAPAGSTITTVLADGELTSVVQ
ncbi:MAG: exodeoxyribonuclease VII large subunit [Paludibacteraceae bacterium]|nr:exodeoxyribonuclease VII large subunit [Paludibacteraceae bacterium]